MFFFTFRSKLKFFMQLRTFHLKFPQSFQFFSEFSHLFYFSQNNLFFDYVLSRTMLLLVYVDVPSFLRHRTIFQSKSKKQILRHFRDNLFHKREKKLATVSFPRKNACWWVVIVFIENASSSVEIHAKFLCRNVLEWPFRISSVNSQQLTTGECKIQ